MAVALGVLLAVVHASPALAQAPPLGTAISYAILAGSGITNTGPSVITGFPGNPGDIGSSGGVITGFPPGVLATGTIHPINDAPTNVAKNDFTTAYNDLSARIATVNLTGQNLGGLTLVPGVYSFNSSAQLTGLLSLNGLGNPNSVFIFNIGSTLTTAAASAVSLINGAQGGNVFWRVGSSATLGTTTNFTGDILALTSITLNTGATINCGVAWAQNGAVTLDTNAITLCPLLVGPVPAPGGGFLFTPLLPDGATTNQIAVAGALDAILAAGGTLPLAFLNLANLSPAELAAAFTQLSGEAATGAAPAGVQAMNSFLSLLTNPFAEGRSFAPPPPPPRTGMAYKAPIYRGAAGLGYDARRWGVWAAVYGGQSTIGGNAFVGSHDRSARTFGYAAGLDYRLTPYTTVGFALAGGNTNFGLSDGLGGGHSDIFQAAVYGTTRIDAAYLSAALAYSWNNVSTERYVTLAGSDQLTAGFSAHNVGGRLEGGYRFAMPYWFGWAGQAGLSPYAAIQAQRYYTPSYSESAPAGSPVFALAYDAHETTVVRSELGARTDWSAPLNANTALTLRSSAAWAHDTWSGLDMNAHFQSVPGSAFMVSGAAPPSDLLLLSTGAEVSFRNGISVGAWVDGEFAERGQRYAGTGRLRYSW
ncbi:MAG: ice-binding family protein [Pseudolabrys sp.]